MPPAEVGVTEPGCGLEAARTVDTRDDTREVGVAEPVVADEERPVTSTRRGVSCSSTGVAEPSVSSRVPRGVSERSMLMDCAWRLCEWRCRSSAGC